LGAPTVRNLTVGAPTTTSVGPPCGHYKKGKIKKKEKGKREKEKK
jgi:hypothetical protein